MDAQVHLKAMKAAEQLPGLQRVQTRRRSYWSGRRILFLTYRTYRLLTKCCFCITRFSVACVPANVRLHTCCTVAARSRS